MNNLNPSRLDLSTPHESTSGIPSNIMPWIVVIFFLLTLYVIYRVWKSLKQEKQKRNVK